MSCSSQAQPDVEVGAARLNIGLHDGNNFSGGRTILEPTICTLPKPYYETGIKVGLKTWDITSGVVKKRIESF